MWRNLRQKGRISPIFYQNSNKKSIKYIQRVNSYHYTRIDNGPSFHLSHTIHDSSVISKKVPLQNEEHPLVRFDQVTHAFKYKSSLELLRALFVFQLFQYPVLVRNSRALIDMSFKVFGHSLTNFALKLSFFGHFCGGENANELNPVINRLETAGVGAILDYAAEADIETSKKVDGIDKSKLSARTYEYCGERQCDANLEITMQCIDAASKSKDGFAAMKLTSLGKPELLQHISSILLDTSCLFSALDRPDLSRKKKCNVSRSIDFETLKAGIKNSGIKLDESSIRCLFDRIDIKRVGKIDYLDWLSFVNPLDLTMGELTQFLRCEKLSKDEIEQMANMIRRLENLASAAADKGVKLMIDAEQTYMQPAIDHLALNLQRKYNKNGSIVIFNTFQSYLKDSQDRLLLDLERARRENFLLGCKLVRGAYMIQERKRANDFGYICPIHNTIQETHANYDEMVDILLKNNDISSFMVASHNVNSVTRTTQRMQQLRIPNSGGGVYFGQLYGMCDHVSFSLGHRGYQVYKYLPYGPVDQVIPYLIRRAEENSDIVSGVRSDIVSLQKELKRRHWFST